jgi:hypothetical protein
LRDLKKRERAAIEAVARQFSATSGRGDNSADAYVVAGGRRFAIDIIALKPRGLGRGTPAEPRLRFDKVATRLIESLKATLGKSVPNGVTVLVTVTAPIRLPSKTIGALGDKITTLLGRRSPARDEKHTIHGNHVRIRLLRDKSGRVPRMIGFVHNSDSDPLLLLDMTRELLERVGEAAKRATAGTSDRWLVVKSPAESSFLETYRGIYSQLRVGTEFQKTVMVFSDGRVGMLNQ